MRKSLDPNKPKLKRFPNLQLVVKRLIELEKEPIGVAMNVRALTHEDTRSREKIRESFVLIGVIDSNALLPAGLHATHDV